MNYVDHVLMFSDEATALVSLTALGHAGPEGFGGHVIAGASITMPTGTWTVKTDESPSVEIRVALPGFYVVIPLPDVSAELIALPGGACRIVSDREAAAEGAPFFRYMAPDLDVALLTIASVSPVFAGSNYPFGI